MLSGVESALEAADEVFELGCAEAVVCVFVGAPAVEPAPRMKLLIEVAGLPLAADRCAAPSAIFARLKCLL